MAATFKEGSACHKSGIREKRKNLEVLALLLTASVILVKVFNPFGPEFPRLLNDSVELHRNYDAVVSSSSCK